MPELTVEILDRSEYKEWDDFVRKSVNGTIYSETIWGEVSKKLEPAIDYMILTVKKGNEIVGGILIFLRKNRVLIPLFTPYESVVYRRIDGENHDIISERRRINEALADYLTTKFFFVTIKQNPEYIDIRDFQFRGFSTTIRYTYFTDLSSYNLDVVNRKNRREIVKVDEKNIFFELVPAQNISYEILAPFFETMDMKVFEMDEGLKRHIMEALDILKERAIVYVLKDKEKILSVRVELVDNEEKIEDWIAGTTLEGREKRITTYFVHRILEDLKSRGYKRFDWNGANTPGVTDFKNSFNGQLKPYIELAIWRNKYLKLVYEAGKLAYKDLRRMFRTINLKKKEPPSK